MKRISGLLTVLIVLLNLSTAMAQDYTTRILVLIHSDNGGTYELAKEIAKGIETHKAVKAVIKQVKASTNPKLKAIPVATVAELTSYDGIAFGSPVYFGNISTPMSEFLSGTVNLWTNHALEGMPATVFMSAGSGAGNELAVQAFWNSLAVHGMVLVSNGIRGYENIDKNIPQGNTVLGTTSLASHKTVERPSEGERYIARLQGEHFAKVVTALKGTFTKKTLAATETKKEKDIEAVLKEKNIIIPQAPNPVGNYTVFSRSGNLVFINQVALKEGKIFNPGKVGVTITEEQAKEASKQTMLNVMAVLKNAVGGDLNRVKKCVQLTGYFNTKEDYTRHADLMNPASDLVVAILGENGKHARGTMGVLSLPLNSAVEIQAIFEVE
ncbi:Atu1372/SO_1960 family protein [Flavobacterium cerinum]|uniref:Atu1372/SO_1960 family protein n=1 Tax=Flavobacterium cerinum TaxID=2502784 RepID=A0ABY5IM84_9FLAO|nr:Atu1372/SO_1960 family protein [Flavobacterium cerinum]UUC43932.1 Atu1372/SO_1960 family protein [Flavobacterium cerinum]